ncbi:integrase [Streptomyces phaeolivaceus]|uniref:Integrase n=1 Tax=Streptomyces phaeolivaceus TaxID=2653200 RepID=A0A5P8K7S7_9ACTN|nr:integrase [Streptomyces phaeolivaceus]QFQ99275.1 integrase [Streptomyces phaeolivaceus]
MATSESARGVQGLTRAELLALPVAVDLDTANRALSIGRSTGYALAKRGQYPCRVLRLGNAYRVVTAELHQLLGVNPAEVTERSELCA